MWPYIAGAVFVLILAAGFLFNYQRSKKINAQGIETTAVISRVKEIESQDSEGRREVEYQYFVRYQNQNGQVVEAKLGNPPRMAREGLELRIKYLPEKPKYALAVKD